MRFRKTPVLSVVGRPTRDGRLTCPGCEGDAFEPVGMTGDFVRCMQCGTRYRRQPPLAGSKLFAYLLDRGRRP